MDEKLINLFYGAALHDIGKVVQRSTGQKVRHSQLGSDFLEPFGFSKAVLDQVKYHHYHELMGATLPTDSLAYITYLADNIASGTDRRENGENPVKQWESQLCLEDVFNKFGTEPSKRYFQPTVLRIEDAPNFAENHVKGFSNSLYAGIVERIKDNLTSITFTEDYFDSILNVLEATLSFIPSSTNMKEVADISLYDHMKMTTGFASCIYHYLTTHNRTDYRQDLFKHADSFYREKAFILASFDLSGIQEFIYTITSSGAHKQLRSRSFYLDMISEWIVDSSLTTCSLPRANIMYAGGGHAYFILPNTPEVRDKLNRTEEAFNAFFLEQFSTKLFVAFGATEFAATEVMQGNTLATYRAIFQKVSQQISEKKVQRYTPDVLIKMNRGGKKIGRECAVCHTVDRLMDGENKCYLCAALENFSKDIQREAFFEVTTDPNGLPIGPDAYLHKTSEEAIKSQQMIGKIYSKNNLYTGLNQGVHLWVADYSSNRNNDFSSYAEREWSKDSAGKTLGIKRIGVMRCDVDDLGYGFMAGFSHQSDGRYNTFSRTAAFSRSMSVFFKLYINQFAKDKHLSIIYSGGDDVFVLGSWDDVLIFGMELRQNFIRWTDGKLTLSAGIGLFADKTPVNIMARLTGELEDAAKSNGKDSICLFDSQNTFKFDVFIDDIWQDKLGLIRTFFYSQTERGKVFLYKLLQLIQERDENDRISFARLAYYLARMENEATDKVAFQTFKISLKEAFEDKEEIKKYEIALRLYLYETRREG